jgi:hypothetical protein
MKGSLPRTGNEPEDLAIWEQYPNAAFVLLKAIPSETEDESLGLVRRWGKLASGNSRRPAYCGHLRATGRYGAINLSRRGSCCPVLTCGAVHERQPRSALVQFCFSHGIGSGSGMGATASCPRKLTTCMGNASTLEPHAATTANESSTFWGKRI